MKTRISSVILFGVAVAATCAFAQGGFQNRSFEFANGLPNLGPGDTAFVPMSNALPGWTGYFSGTNQITLALYNSISYGSVLVTLIGNSSIYSNSVIAGKYTATIDAGEFTDTNGSTFFASAAIAQTGLVPGTALSLRFDASGNVLGYMTVTFDGKNIPFYPLSAGPNYEVYGGDVSGFAGQTGELRFTENPTTSNPFATAFLDNIVFSTSPVPEPTACALILCSAVVFWANRRRHRLASLIFKV
jgi:hypothetical protein